MAEPASKKSPTHYIADLEPVVEIVVRRTVSQGRIFDLPPIVAIRVNVQKEDPWRRVKDLFKWLIRGIWFL